MKTVKDLLKNFETTDSTMTDNDTSTQKINNETIVEQNVINEELLDKKLTIDDIPKYMKTDPQVMGYPSIEDQEFIYRKTIEDVIPISGKISVLDLGCGRADFAKFLIKNTACELDYIGVEWLETYALIAEHNLKQLPEPHTGEILLENMLLIDAERLGKKVDFAFLIGSLNYMGDLGEKWDTLDRIIENIMPLVNVSFTMILIDHADPDTDLTFFACEEVINIVKDKNLLFKVDYTFMENGYKITLFNKS